LGDDVICSDEFVGRFNPSEAPRNPMVMLETANSSVYNPIRKDEPSDKLQAHTGATSTGHKDLPK
jgi:hypothetical protein